MHMSNIAEFTTHITRLYVMHMYRHGSCTKEHEKENER